MENTQHVAKGGCIACIFVITITQGITALSLPFTETIVTALLYLGVGAVAVFGLLKEFKWSGIACFIYLVPVGQVFLRMLKADYKGTYAGIITSWHSPYFVLIVFAILLIYTQFREPNKAMHRTPTRVTPDA